MQCNDSEKQQCAGINRGTNSAVRGSSVAARSSEARSRSSSPQRVRSLSAGVPPGYAGHVPRRDSSNFYGKGFKAANKEAAIESALDVAAAWAGSLRTDTSRTRDEAIPGYAGYVPRKGPQNIHGTSFRSANAQAASDANECTAKEAKGLWAKAPRERSTSKKETVDEYRPESSRSSRSASSRGSR